MLFRISSKAIHPHSASRALKAASRMFISVLLAVPMFGDCLPSVPTGWQVPVYMSAHDVANHVVNYTTGNLVNTSATVPFLSGNRLPQLFSDRDVPCTSQPCSFIPQPFSASNPDNLGISITRAVTPGTLNTTISVTLTLESWGNAKYTFPAACDATTGLLYGSFSNNTMAVISFGTPTAPPPNQ
jgi:hypothetical protein